MTGDSGIWNWQHVGCGQRDNMKQDHVGMKKLALPACNRCTSVSTANVDPRVAVWCALGEMTGISVCSIEYRL